VDAGQVPIRGLDRRPPGFAAPDRALLLILLLGLALRLPPLVRDPLHQDEALYGYWGRLVSSGRDAWLSGVPVDKPPLVPYLIAGSQTVFGVSEFSLRLPALAASLLAIPLVVALARALYADRHVARVAAAVVALSPFPVLFGAAGFTDAALVTAWLAAAVAALRGRWGWAGLMLGLAFASKQQALLLAPLVLALGTLRARPEPVGWRAVGRFLIGLAAVLALVVGWNAIRVAGQDGGVGFWQQSVASYGGLRLIWGTELVPRLRGWLALGDYLFGWPVLSGLAGLTGVGLLARALASRRPTRAALADVVLMTFALFYLVLHWLVAFPVWDRYLLPLVPVLGLLVGRGVALLFAAARGRQGSRVSVPVFNLVVVGALLASGVWAALGRVPIGGDHGAYDGLRTVVAFLKRLPVGTVVYDRWLSWHYDYYLFDAYLYRAGFPSPDWLAADAAAFYDGRPRYLVLPGWESASRLQRSLAGSGLAMVPVLRTYGRNGALSFTVYEIGSDD
jgi:4-amino-4-deoxy-L-arabinose transferase-like glycosyltransferase